MFPLKAYTLEMRFPDGTVLTRTLMARNYDACFKSARYMAAEINKVDSEKYGGDGSFTLVSKITGEMSD